MLRNTATFMAEAPDELSRLDRAAQGAAAAVPAARACTASRSWCWRCSTRAIPTRVARWSHPLRHLGHAAGEHVGVQPYTAWQQAFDPLLTPGARNYWKSHNFTQLDDRLLDVVIRYAEQSAVARSARSFWRRSARSARAARADAVAYAASRYALRDERSRPLARAGRRRALHRLGARLLRGADTIRAAAAST